MQKKENVSSAKFNVQNCLITGISYVHKCVILSGFSKECGQKNLRYVVDTQNIRLNETVLLSAQNIC